MKLKIGDTVIVNERWSPSLQPVEAIIRGFDRQGPDHYIAVEILDPSISETALHCCPYLDDGPPYGGFYVPNQRGWWVREDVVTLVVKPLRDEISEIWSNVL